MNGWRNRHEESCDRGRGRPGGLWSTKMGSAIQVMLCREHAEKTLLIQYLAAHHLLASIPWTPLPQREGGED